MNIQEIAFSILKLTQQMASLSAQLCQYVADEAALKEVNVVVIPPPTAVVENVTMVEAVSDVITAPVPVTQIESVSDPSDDNAHMINMFVKTCEEYDFIPCHYKLNLYIVQNQDFTAPIPLGIDNINAISALRTAKDKTKYFSNAIVRGFCKHTFGLTNYPTIQEILDSEYLYNNKYKFMDDILPIILWEQAINYELYEMNDNNSRILLMRSCLNLIHTFLQHNRIKWTTSVRIGNNVKFMLTDWFKLIGYACCEHKFVLGYMDDLRKFWENMFMHVGDIRWFILDCAVKWSISINMKPLIEALKLIDINAFSEQLSRDTMYLLKRVQKGSYTVHNYIIDALEAGVKNDNDEEHLTELIHDQMKSGYDFKSHPEYMYHAYLGVYKNGGLYDVLDWLESIGFKKWQGNVEEMVKTKDTEQFSLSIAINHGKEELMYKRCYEICASNGWFDQAMWLYRYDAKNPVKIHPGALDLAYHLGNISFIDDIITAQELYRFHGDHHHMQWGITAGIFADSRHAMKECSPWWVNWVVICLKHSGSTGAIKHCKLPYRTFINNLVRALLISWYECKVLPFDQVDSLNYILTQCGEIENNDLHSLVMSTLVAPANAEKTAKLIKRFLDTPDGHETLRLYHPLVFRLFECSRDAYALFKLHQSRQ